MSKIKQRNTELISVTPCNLLQLVMLHNRGTTPRHDATICRARAAGGSIDSSELVGSDWLSQPGWVKARGLTWLSDRLRNQ